MDITKEWYVARADNGITPPLTHSGLVYVFGGSLSEVKAYIDSAPAATRRFFTWVPSEFVENDLINS